MLLSVTYSMASVFEMSSTDNPIFELWIDLSKARAEALDLSPPWESPVQSVQSAWAELTEPDNLSHLQECGRSPDTMNPIAKEAFMKALQQCLSKQTVKRIPDIYEV